MSRDNNINLLRLIFALLVLFSHSFSICFLNEPIVGKGYGIGSIGTLGVYGFFTLSGFLMISSYIKYNNLLIFLWHRFLRVYPALVLSVVLSAFLMYFAQDKINFIEYIQLNNFKNFILGNATLINIGYNSIDYILVGVNQHNIINGPLWTLPIELRMYLFVALLGYLSLLSRKFFNLFLILIFFVGFESIYNFILYKALEPIKMQSLNLVFYFFTGMFFALNNIQMKKYLFVLSSLIFIISINIQIPQVFQVISISYLVYYMAFNFNLLRNFFNTTIGDYSYGIYIYTFPIQQLVYYIAKKNFNVNLTVLELILISLILIVPLSALSWHCLESKILKFKNLFNKNKDEL